MTRPLSLLACLMFGCFWLVVALFQTAFHKPPPLSRCAMCGRRHLVGGLHEDGDF